MKLLIYIAIVFIFSSCGAGGSTTTWGIDNKSGVPLPVCDGNQTTTTNAITVSEYTQITKTKEPTYIRIWHYQSGIKKVCTIQGEAIIDG